MTAHMTIAELGVKIDGDIYTVPCLGGEDVSRRPGDIVVRWLDGRLVDARDDGPLHIRPGGPLKGWGTLDGPSMIVSRTPDGSGVNVPVAILDALAGLFGVEEI